MKYALFAALSIVSLFACAGENTHPSSPTADTSAQYDYTQDLDIAKIVRTSNAAKACGPVKAQMEYVDSKGVMHKLEYTRLGDSCQNG